MLLKRKSDPCRRHMPVSVRIQNRSPCVCHWERALSGCYPCQRYHRFVTLLYIASIGTLWTILIRDESSVSDLILQTSLRRPEDERSC